MLTQTEVRTALDKLNLSVSDQDLEKIFESNAGPPGSFEGVCVVGGCVVGRVGGWVGTRAGGWVSESNLQLRRFHRPIHSLTPRRHTHTQTQTPNTRAHTHAHTHTHVRARAHTQVAYQLPWTSLSPRGVSCGLRLARSPVWWRWSSNPHSWGMIRGPYACVCTRVVALVLNLSLLG